MFNLIDKSAFLSKLLERTSNYLAERRGLLPVIGVAILFVSFAIQIADVFTSSRWVELLGVVTLNLGVLIALIGILLLNPLGK
jgi:uncharacterized membrane protein YidH (DUF202 family)